MTQRAVARLALLAMLVGLLFAGMPGSPAYAANPGEQIANGSGTVPAGSTFTIPFYSSDSINIMLHNGTAPATNTLIFSIVDGTTPTVSWTVRGGETAWGYANVSPTTKLEIRNPGGANVTYEFAAYARATLPVIADGLASWNGVATGAGMQSAAQFDVAQPGLYRFTLGAGNGAYQLSVDDGYVLKSVVAGSAPAADDSTYYLDSGTHTFRIVQNSTAPETQWSVGVAQAGATDTLPANEASAVLGSGMFTEEHVPLQFADAQNANFRMAVAGSPADSVIVELLNGSTVAATSDPIHGGEVVWMSGELAAGANSLRIVAAQGNPSPVAYTIDASVVGDVPFSWAGTSYGAPTHASDGGSSVRLNFPTDGVYQFKLATQAGGRFQFVLGDNLLRRTVDAAAEAQFTAFIPAGLHTLSMMQAPGAATTAWSVEIAPGEATSDSLPFQRTSSTFGGPGDTFREEWIPLQYSGTQPVNIRISVTGAATDSVSLELFNQKTLAYTAAKVYGGEVLWNAAALTNGTNFLHITAGAANSGPVTYQVEVVDIPAAPLSWSGVAYAASQNSTASFYAPVTGVYTFSLSISEGAGLITIDDAAATQGRASLAAGSKSELRVPLSAGLHTVTFQQSADQRTIWTIDVKQRATGPWIVSLPLVIASAPAQ